MDSTTDSLHSYGEMPVEQLLFSLNGRIGRWTYWDATLFFACAGLVVLLVHWALFVFYCFLTSWPNFAVTVKRWHDRDKSSWWVLIGLIPFIGWIWALVELGFLRGTIGPNRYGQDPVQIARRDEIQDLHSLPEIGSAPKL